MGKMRTIPAIREALLEEMHRDPKTILIGQDVGISVMGDTIGLEDIFGKERVRDMPICENVMVGTALGAAASGYRVICHMMYSNFLWMAYDAIANQAAKLRYMTAGQIMMPVTFIAASGGGKSSAAQHSDSIHPTLMNAGGLEVVAPSNPADAKGLVKAAIRSNNPTIVLQSAGRKGGAGVVPEGDHIVPLGKGDIKRDGEHVTLVAIGSMVGPALEAAASLSEQGISVEVVDPRTLVPLDLDLIEASVNKTRRIVVVDEARDLCSAASHINAVIADRLFGRLQAPPKRVTVQDVAIPYSPALERAVIPQPDLIAQTVRDVALFGTT